MVVKTLVINKSLLVETDRNEQELNPDYDLEDVTDSLKEAFIDIHKGNTKPLEDLLNEL